MKYEVHAVESLPSSHLLAWDDLLGLAGPYKNPNFSPWFARAVSAHRPTLAGMLWNKDILLAVMPFHRLSGGGVCEALALGVSDYHGPLFHPDSRVPYVDFIHRLGIEEFRFDHLMADLRIRNRPMAWQPTHLINLAKGETGYRWDLRNRKSHLWAEMTHQWRRLEREVGPLSFVADLRSAETLAVLIEWKSRQFRRTQALDDFDMPWNAPFLHELLRTRERSCTGLLSGLFVNKFPIALHMGSVSPEVLQTCYTAYDPAYAEYSPGSLLLFSQVTHCLRQGIPILDLGKGNEPYKRRWANDSLWVAEGRLTI